MFSIVWLAVSMLLMSLEWVYVLYNVAVILAESAVIFLLRRTRYALRWVSFTPSRMQHKKRVHRLLLSMQAASSFEQWLLCARELDDVEGATAWRMGGSGAEARQSSSQGQGQEHSSSSEEYDAELVAYMTAKLRADRRAAMASSSSLSAAPSSSPSSSAAADWHTLLFDLRTVLHRQFGGIDAPSLFERAYCGTACGIEALQREICRALDAVAAAPAPAAANGYNGLTDEVKAEFLDRARLQIGRTALALSGGGALALAHLGVAKCLLQAGLLPRVIAGTSGGAIVAGLLATRSDAEYLQLLMTPQLLTASGARFLPPARQMVASFLRDWAAGKAPAMVDTETFGAALRTFLGDATFLDAFQRTGRIVCVSVVARYGRNKHAPTSPLLLSYLTAPHVLLWSAVAASCALPGLMRPTTLLARDASGVVRPYAPAGVQSVDGSLGADLPHRELGLLFHCQRVIASQANPHVVPFLSTTAAGASGGAVKPIDSNIVSRLLMALQITAAVDVRSRVLLLSKLRLLPRFFGEDASQLFLQSYEGHCTIVPHYPAFSQWRALVQPDEAGLRALVAAGERATWPALAHIRSLVAIEKKLSACSRRFAYVFDAASGGPQRQFASASALRATLLQVPHPLALAAAPPPGGTGLIPASDPPAPPRSVSFAEPPVFSSGNTSAATSASSLAALPLAATTSGDVPGETATGTAAGTAAAVTAAALVPGLAARLPAVAPTTAATARPAARLTRAFYAAQPTSGRATAAASYASLADAAAGEGEGEGEGEEAAASSGSGGNGGDGDGGSRRGSSFTGGGLTAAEWRRRADELMRVCPASSPSTPGAGAGERGGGSPAAFFPVAFPVGPLVPRPLPPDARPRLPLPPFSQTPDHEAETLTTAAAATAAAATAAAGESSRSPLSLSPPSPQARSPGASGGPGGEDSSSSGRSAGGAASGAGGSPLPLLSLLAGGSSGPPLAPHEEQLLRAGAATADRLALPADYNAFPADSSTISSTASSGSEAQPAPQPQPQAPERQEQQQRRQKQQQLGPQQYITATTTAAANALTPLPGAMAMEEPPLLWSHAHAGPGPGPAPPGPAGPGLRAAARQLLPLPLSASASSSQEEEEEEEPSGAGAAFMIGALDLEPERDSGGASGGGGDGASATRGAASAGGGSAAGGSGSGGGGGGGGGTASSTPERHTGLLPPTAMASPGSGLLWPPTVVPAPFLLAGMRQGSATRKTGPTVREPPR